MGLVSELIGGPLDGLEVEIDDPFDPVSTFGFGVPEGLASIQMDWCIPARPDDVITPAVYTVMIWRGCRRLVFDGYADE